MRWVQVAKWLLGAALIVGGYALALAAFVTVMNADLYGRLIETHVAKGVGNPNDSPREIPIVRLVIHKFLSDENAVEVSLIVNVDGGALADRIRAGEVRLTAAAHDASSYQFFALRSRVTLDSVTADVQPGVFPVATQSLRFFLPALPSVWGFPFDDLTVRPIIDVFVNGSYTNNFRLEIQKALRGRLMKLSDDNIVTIRLTRTPTEKTLVIVGSAVFLFLSGILAFSLFAARPGLTTLGELLAVGGYLLAAAGFRELLGVSRAAGTSALEVATIGLPLLLLASAVAVSFIRGRIQLRQRRASDRSADSASG